MSSRAEVDLDHGLVLDFEPEHALEGRLVGEEVDVDAEAAEGSAFGWGAAGPVLGLGLEVFEAGLDAVAVDAERDLVVWDSGSYCYGTLVAEECGF